ncbi:hypothetical protein NSPZN2_30049 [Nitrospira defluvii]|uniref:Uncharacterized protein n=1 Tax=Nitrospira defluvii TaxID=330214 RepID=A0ABM8REL8_9BACT|nr:hypothetical protein NSPZN2_30049 [Nitrospira defluvii]
MAADVAWAGAGTKLRSLVYTYSGAAGTAAPAFSSPYCPLFGLQGHPGCLPLLSQDRDLGVVLHGVVCRIVSYVVSC